MFIGLQPKNSVKAALSQLFDEVLSKTAPGWATKGLLEA